MSLPASAVLMTEFDRQLGALVELGYPAAAGVSPRTFRRWFAHLRPVVGGLPPQLKGAALPFVVVVPRSMVPTEQAMAFVRQGSEVGYVGMDGAKPLADYTPIEGIDLPTGPYLALDLDTGDPALNLTCETYVRDLAAGGRSPLTIDEGVALATQHQGILRSSNCVWLMGERAGDRRVPALWVSRKAPRIGWCWAGMPHDWLGAASCASRTAA